jgi:hypothetical protein
MNNQNKANGHNSLRATEKAFLAASCLMIGNAALTLYKKRQPKLPVTSAEAEAKYGLGKLIEQSSQAKLCVEALDTIFRYSQADLINIPPADSSGLLQQRKISKVINNPNVEYVIVDRYLPLHDNSKSAPQDTDNYNFPQSSVSQYKVNIYKPCSPDFNTASDDRAGVLICISPDDKTNPILAYNFMRRNDYLAEVLDVDPEIMLESACSGGYERDEIKEEFVIANYIREAFKSIDVGSRI